MKESTRYNFVRVGNGRLDLNHRPGARDFPLLRELGCTHVVTLLKESEFAETIGSHVLNADMEWVWIPVPNGKYPERDVHARLLAAMPMLSQLLDEGKSMLIHCAAGIHRTGLIAYGLLRWRGLERDEAMRIIRRIRKETAEGMMQKRMRWGDENARPPAKEKTWVHSVSEFVRRLRMKLSRLR